METALRELGFTVDKVLNGNLEQMEDAVLNFTRRLSASRDTYGFFFYAGHGVQSSGENYLIPVEADNIRSENQLRSRSVSLQFVLDSMSDAGNELNMIVLDACRDNPFSWARGGSRGLTVLSGAPAGSIVMYATSANSIAEDGSGRNGLFTGQLLNNIRTPGMSIRDIFDKTGEDVLRVSEGRQHPELSMRYFAAATAYLGPRPLPVPEPEPIPAALPVPEPVAITPQPAPIQPYPVPEQPGPYYTPWQRAGGSKYLINTGGGIATTGGGGVGFSISASFEYLFPNGPSLGAHVAYASGSSIGLYSDSSGTSQKITALSAKAAWNWNVKQNMLPYLGLLVGANIGDAVNIPSWENAVPYNSSLNSLAFGLNLGMRYFFSNNVGAFVDTVFNTGPFNTDPNGWGVFGAASLGLAMKF
jgi:hypothetical protein